LKSNFSFKIEDILMWMLLKDNQKSNKDNKGFKRKNKDLDL